MRAFQRTHWDVYPFLLSYRIDITSHRLYFGGEKSGIWSAYFPIVSLPILKDLMEQFHWPKGVTLYLLAKAIIIVRWLFKDLNEYKLG